MQNCKIGTLEEKSNIISFPKQDYLLNKKPDLISKWRHENKYLMN